MGTRASTVDPAGVHGPRRPKLLVTGFCDWRDLGDPPTIWRCRDNPSGRLLTGAVTEDRAPPLQGPLAEGLRRAEDLDVDLALLPVTWGAFAALPPIADYDAVFHIGLGSEQDDDQILLETGATNLRERQDALGEAPPTALIEPGGPAIRLLLPDMEAAVRALAGRRLGDYRLLAAEPRPSNVFLCNETLFLTLTAAAAAPRPVRATFVHIPASDAAALGPLSSVLLGLLRVLAGAG